MQASRAFVICPDCASRYAVPAQALGHGRTVRCTACGHHWYATSEDEQTDRMVAAWAEDARSESLAASLTAADPPITLDARDLGGHGEHAVIEALDGHARRKRISRASQGSGARKAAATLVGASVAMVVAAILHREAVVRKVPDLAGLYSVVGLPVNFRGLEFRNFTSRTGLEKGWPVLVVDGEIVNTGGADAALPPLALTVRDASGEPLHTWTVRAPKERAAAGESVRFHAALASPPTASEEVFVSFGGHPESGPAQ